ncbi:MAG: hypothetical protein JO263_08330, partial [Candidatus Eremiobacteraeota bacterium]|nr:hypothetical protein [Candidatus Eremiobacteraeota bacterium]
MTNAPLRLFWTAAAAALLAACSRGAPAPSMLPASGGYVPQTIQQNNGSNWVTIPAGNLSFAFNCKVLAGAGVLYVCGQALAQPFSIVTIGMDQSLSYPNVQAKCPFNGINYNVYAYDLTLNAENENLYWNNDIQDSQGHPVLAWGLIQPNGSTACFTNVGVALNSTSYYTALGPNDTIWITAGGNFYLFSHDGTLKSLPMDKSLGVGLFGMVYGPDRVMWGVTAAAALVRINPSTGKLLSTFGMNCEPNQTLASFGGKIWSVGDGCIFSVTPKGVQTTYSVPNFNGLSSGYRLTQGPDGNPWFTGSYNGAQSLGTVDLKTKAVTVYTVPVQQHGAVRSLGTGPDRNIYLPDG